MPRALFSLISSLLFVTLVSRAVFLRTVFFELLLHVCYVGVLCTVFFELQLIVCYARVFRTVFFDL